MGFPSVSQGWASFSSSSEKHAVGQSLHILLPNLLLSTVQSLEEVRKRNQSPHPAPESLQPWNTSPHGDAQPCQDPHFTTCRPPVWARGPSSTARLTLLRRAHRRSPDPEGQAPDPEVSHPSWREAEGSQGTQGSATWCLSSPVATCLGCIISMGHVAWISAPRHPQLVSLRSHVHVLGWEAHNVIKQSSGSKSSVALAGGQAIKQSKENPRADPTAHGDLAGAVGSVSSQRGFW